MVLESTEMRLQDLGICVLEEEHEEGPAYSWRDVTGQEKETWPIEGVWRPSDVREAMKAGYEQES